MPRNSECIEDCCEIPICLKIVDVCMTQEAKEKWCTILCECENDNNNDDD